MIFTEIKLLVPTATVPKFAVEGLNASVPCDAAALLAHIKIAHAASAAPNRFRSRGRRSFRSDEMVSGVTVKKLFTKVNGLNPCDCIPPAGYDSHRVETTELKKKKRTGTFHRPKGALYLSFGTGPLNPIFFLNGLRCVFSERGGYCMDSSNSFIQLLPLSTSRGRVPSGGPTMPSFSMMSIR